MKKQQLDDSTVIFPHSVYKNLFIGNEFYYVGVEKKAAAVEGTFSVFENNGARVPIGVRPKLSRMELEQMCLDVESSYDALNQLSYAKRAEFAIILAKQILVPSVCEVIAVTIMLETGKAFADARKEVVRTAEFIREYAEYIKDQSNDQMIDGHLIKKMGKGLGVHFSPTNYPINEGITVVIARLLAGNPMLYKPASACMASAHAFEQLALVPAIEIAANRIADFPKNCIAVLYGSGRDVTPIVARHVKHISFIGSESGKKSIWQHFNKVEATEDRRFAVSTMNPYVVLPNSLRIKEISGKLVQAAYGNRGERCTAPGLIFLPMSEANVYIQHLKEACSELKLGYPWESGVQITMPTDGSQKNTDNFNYVLQNTMAGNAELLHPTMDELEAATNLFPPTLMKVNDLFNPCAHEETFGVITCVYVYDDSRSDWLADLENYMIELDKGQQLAIFGEKALAMAVAAKLQKHTCGIFINELGGRGPDSLPFYHTGKAGYGSLSGYKTMYEDSLKYLRMTVFRE